MTVAELKLKIFRKVDSLDESRLEELYGILLNYINGNKNINEWDKLSEEQKAGINSALKEIKSGQGVDNESVIENIRNKFHHA